MRPGRSINRRTFLKTTAALSSPALWPTGCATVIPDVMKLHPRPKRPALVRGAFFYPPLDVVLRGELEDGWAHHQWCTWPGNQYKPEEQQTRFMEHIRPMAAGLDLTLALDETPIYTNTGIQAFINEVKETKPDALMLFNFWNTFSAKIVPIVESFDGPVIVYHPVGANHQLPPQKLDTAARTQYIHSVENWGALERGLRALHAQNSMKQSRLLRVSGRFKEEVDANEPLFGTSIHGVPAGHYNDLYDEVQMTSELESLARAVRRRADSVTDLADKAFLDAARAHETVRQLMKRHDADAVTIECLFLKHRKPCLSFAMNNGSLVPSGCENDLNATLSLMLGASLFGRGGFQHNPEFDTEENTYLASHCTCPIKLQGPTGAETPHALRPFFHQLPKTLALDVKWPAGERATLFKYHSGGNRMDAWHGEVLGSPGCPPVGGCATRVLVKMNGVKDIRTVYPGPHPILYCGDFTRHVATFAELYGMDIRTNA